MRTLIVWFLLTLPAALQQQKYIKFMFTSSVFPYILFYLNSSFLISFCQLQRQLAVQLVVCFNVFITSSGSSSALEEIYVAIDLSNSSGKVFNQFLFRSIGMVFSLLQIEEISKQDSVPIFFALIPIVTPKSIVCGIFYVRRPVLLISILQKLQFDGFAKEMSFSNGISKMCINKKRENYIPF